MQHGVCAQQHGWMVGANFSLWQQLAAVFSTVRLWWSMPAIQQYQKQLGI
jgi:hypothetical protein